MKRLWLAVATFSLTACGVEPVAPVGSDAPPPASLRAVPANGVVPCGPMIVWKGQRECSNVIATFGRPGVG